MKKCPCSIEMMPHIRIDIVAAVFGLIISSVAVAALIGEVSSADPMRPWPLLFFLFTSFVGLAIVGIGALKCAVDYLIYRKKHLTATCGGVPSKL